MSPARSRAKRTPLPHSFYARETEVVSRALLGKVLVSTVDGKRVEGRIVETEAYIGPHDPASHAAERIGRTKRNRAMFGPAGFAYVYRIYGVHWCLNAVTREADYPAAVLIRAVEPMYGLQTMRDRRWPAGASGSDRQLASGPGRLAAAFGITGALDHHDLIRPPLYIVGGDEIGDEDIVAGPRIGITQAIDWPLRFCVRGSTWLSRKTGSV